MMDLAGLKIRTGQVLAPLNQTRVFKGDHIVLSRCEPQLYPEAEVSVEYFQTCCTVPDILDLLTVDTPVYIDDGKIRTRVVDTQYPILNTQPGLLLQVTHASPKGVKLRPEKGLNFPQTILPLSPLTAKDLSDLDFVATHADIIGYSFVQRAADIELLQQELDKRLGEHLPHPELSLKLKRRSRLPIYQN